MKTKLLLLTAVAIVFASTSSWAQLSTGDISFIGYNADVDDNILFVTWVDIPDATSIHFTESGFFSDGTLRSTEGNDTWTSSGITTAGSVIEVSGFSFSASGDTLVAGTSPFPTTSGNTTAPGASVTGTLLQGINMDGGWVTSSSDASNSALPTALDVQYGNFSLPTEVDNAVYTGTRNFTSIDLAKASVFNTSNWDTSDSSEYTFDTTSFVIPEPSSIALVAIAALVAAGLLRNRKK